MRYLRWFLLFALLLAAGFTLAQEQPDLSETYTYGNRSFFHYPGDWTLEDKPGYLVDVYDDSTIIYAADFTFFQTSGMSKDDDLIDAVRQYFNDFYKDLRFQSDNVQTLSFDGREALRYDYVLPDTKARAFVVAMRFSDGTYGVMEAVSQVRNFPESDLALAIAASFDVPTASGSSADTAAAATSEGTDCTISTSQANSVHIRVGPGTNRTSYAFLPTDEDFAVLGKASDKEGKLWWKLDKEAVAPGKSAAEAWVAANDVDSSGSCDSVVDVNAPPVIPIVNAPPANTGATDSGGAEVSGGAEPSAGSWTVSYAPYAPGSCLNGGTVNIPTGFSPERATVSGSGSRIIFAGDVFNRTQPGVYQGLYSAPDGSSVLTTLRVASPTLMGIEFILNFKVDNTPCSITINGTVTHN